MTPGEWLRMWLFVLWVATPIYLGRLLQKGR